MTFHRISYPFTEITGRKELSLDGKEYNQKDD
jgi:hypothetical protein